MRDCAEEMKTAIHAVPSFRSPPRAPERVTGECKNLINGFSKHSQKRPGLGAQSAVSRMDQVEASAQRFRVENPHGGELASLNFSPHREKRLDLIDLHGLRDLIRFASRQLPNNILLSNVRILIIFSYQLDRNNQFDRARRLPQNLLEVQRAHGSRAGTLSR